jgi:hypothetical protein
MIIVRLTVAVLLLVGLAAASTVYEPIDTTNFGSRAGTYQGRLVAVTADVCAVNADGKSIQLFDPQSKALIDVTLTQLKRIERRALMLNPVRRVSVYGRAEMRNGRLIIDAHQVVALAGEDSTQAQAAPSNKAK